MLGACASHSGVRDDAPPPPVGGTPADVVPDPVGDATAPAQLPADDTIEATISPADESLPTVAPQTGPSAKTGADAPTQAELDYAAIYGEPPSDPVYDDPPPAPAQDRKSVVSGKSGSVRVTPGGART